MTMRAIILAASVLASASAFAQDKANRTGSFVDADGQPSGSAELIGVAAGGVLIRIEVSGLPAGQWVAFHVHETGECDAATDHESAGGHFNPGDREHGFQSAEGPHAGDMANQFVGEDGVLRAEVYNAFVTLDESETGIVGRALMIHAGADDYESQPSGDAGDRLACAVIE